MEPLTAKEARQIADKNSTEGLDAYLNLIKSNSDEGKYSLMLSRNKYLNPVLKSLLIDLGYIITEHMADKNIVFVEINW